MNDALRKAREILRDVTPLKSDCGRICGARCCQSLEAEESGMLLFPGEEEAYRDKAGWILRDTSAGLLVICPGRCRREERPLACRLFPLLPVIRESGIKAGGSARCCARGSGGWIRPLFPRRGKRETCWRRMLNAGLSC